MSARRDRLTVAEAAEVLGLTEGAIRKRIQRGQVESDRDEAGRVYVYLDPEDAEAARHEKRPPAELIAALEEQNRLLKQELADWKEEARRKDHIIAGLVSRIPELEAAPEERESAAAAQEETQQEEEPRRRSSWWRRLIGGG